MRFLAAVLLGFFMVSGCQGLMVQTRPLGLAAEDRVVVTFMYPHSHGVAGSFDLWEGASFLGVVSPGDMLQVESAPGVRMYMAKATNWSIVEATLEAGNNYYLLLRPGVGTEKTYVTIDPIDQSDEEMASNLPGWLARLRPLGVNDELVEDYTEESGKEAAEIVGRAENGKVEVRQLIYTDFNSSPVK